MTLKELQNHFLNGLQYYYPKEEIHSFFAILASHQLELSRAESILKANIKVEDDDLSFFLDAFEDLQQEKPIQYILGKTEFYGLPFKVNKDVLIPRPETEELVQWVLDEVKEKRKKSKGNSTLKVLDIGTGSGCIAVSLAKYLPNAKVYALDVSEKALKIAKLNAALNKVDIHFIQLDILKSDAALSLSNHLLNEQKFDIIISNPPYVRELEKHEIKNNVLDNEPHLALFVKDENPLLFYDIITNLAKKQLIENGLLFFEINQYLGKETVELLKEKGLHKIDLRKDLFENYRMLKATMPSVK